MTIKADRSNVNPGTRKPGSYTRKDLNNQLDQDPLAVEAGILRLYSLQTQSEQAIGVTTQQNGVGFCGNSAEFGTSLANWILKSKRQPGYRLTKRQLYSARKVVKRHGSQLVEYATATGRFAR